MTTTAQTVVLDLLERLLEEVANETPCQTAHEPSKPAWWRIHGVCSTCLHPATVLACRACREAARVNGFHCRECKANLDWAGFVIAEDGLQ